MRVFMIAASILASALSSQAVWAASEEEEATLTKVGDAAPPFDFTTLDGKRIDNASAKGKVVVLNFFATWCGPCQAELPHVEKLWNRLKTEDLIVLAAGREHTREEMKQFNEEKKFTFLLAPDPERKVYSGYATKFIPRTYVIDRDGQIVFQSVGFDNAEFDTMTAEVEKLLKSALEEKKSEAKAITSSGANEADVSVPGLQRVEVHGEIRTRAQAWKGRSPRG